MLDIGLLEIYPSVDHSVNCPSWLAGEAIAGDQRD